VECFAATAVDRCYAVREGDCGEWGRTVRAVGLGVFVAGGPGVAAALQWDGGAWHRSPLPAVPVPAWASSAEAVPEDLVVVAASDVWAVGGAVYYDSSFHAMAAGGVSWHWNGSAWTYRGGYVTTPSSRHMFKAIWHSPGGDLWAVGGSASASSHTAPLPLVVSWNGKRWVRTSAPGKYVSLVDISGTANDDFWVVGVRQRPGSYVQAVAMHWNGYGWDLVPEIPDLGEESSLSGVAAIAANDVWAVGRRKTSPWEPICFHWDGSQWSLVPLPNTGTGMLWDVDGDARTNVWAVGASGTPSHWRSLILRWTGSKWTRQPASDPSNLLPGSTYNYLWSVSVRGARVWSTGPIVAMTVTPTQFVIGR
jgi:hypothetical protein